MSTTTDELSVVFAALADPTRRAMLDRLRSGEATLNELAVPFGMSLQGVSQHLKVLERAGLVTRGRVAQTRPARLASSGLEAASGWLEHYRESFERLDEYLEDLQAGEERS
jgi:DNA-binding transcriptional ArsR family regulator